MYFCDVHNGAILYFENLPNYFMRVRGNAVSGVVNLETGKFYDVDDLRQCGIDPNHAYYVARNLDELYQEEEE